VFGIAFIATALSMIVTVGVYHFELAGMTTERDALKNQIYAEGTGLIARNTQCETNIASLNVGLKNARDDINSLAASTVETNKKTIAALTAAAAQVRTVKTATDKLLATPASAPIGSTQACSAGAHILKTGAP
jgi:hypothetical protein